MITNNYILEDLKVNYLSIKEIKSKIKPIKDKLKILNITFKNIQTQLLDLSNTDFMKEIKMKNLNIGNQNQERGFIKDKCQDLKENFMYKTNIKILDINNQI